MKGSLHKEELNIIRRYIDEGKIKGKIVDTSEGREYRISEGGILQLRELIMEDVKESHFLFDFDKWMDKYSEAMHKLGRLEAERDKWQKDNERLLEYKGQLDMKENIIKELQEKIKTQETIISENELEIKERDMMLRELQQNREKKRRFPFRLFKFKFKG